jgi:hypothetical protein
VRSPNGRNSRERVARYNAMIPRIIKHEAVPDCGSYEVRFGDGRASKFFYWDDQANQRLRLAILTSVVALMQAKAFARAMSDKDDDR